jgi:class 3 adenylate cyclase
VTVLFADIVDFTGMSAAADPVEVVNLLNDVFSEFDRLAEKYRLEKIKTIGDAYMVAAGLPEPRADHTQAIAAFAVEML